VREGTTLYSIVKNNNRYPGIDSNLPDRVVVFCTLAEAITLAEQLSACNPGCDYSWYVEE